MENCSKPKSLQDETKLETGSNASLKLQCRETMEIRTKHLRAGFEASFEAGLEGLKAMEIGAKQYESI
jgi:hypothetical protein